MNPVTLLSVTFAAEASPVSTDVALVIGGQFSPDHLGPEAYAAVIARVAAAPADHLQALTAQVRVASTAQLLTLWPSALLRLTWPLDPVGTQAATAEIQATYQKVKPLDAAQGAALALRLQDLATLRAGKTP
jgi:hypothetical protein